MDKKVTEEREEVEGVPRMWAVICGGCGRVVKPTNTENDMRNKLRVAVEALEFYANPGSYSAPTVTPETIDDAIKYITWYSPSSIAKRTLEEIRGEK